MTLAYDDDTDLDGLPPEVRERRLKIRREIQASLSHIGETPAEKEFREHSEAVQRRKQAEAEAKEREAQQAVQQTASWADSVNGQIAAAMAAHDTYHHHLIDALGQMFGEERRQQRAELDEEIRRLFTRRDDGRRGGDAHALDSR